MYRKRIFVASTLAVLVGVCGCDKTPAVKTVAASGTDEDDLRAPPRRIKIVHSRAESAIRAAPGLESGHSP